MIPRPHYIGWLNRWKDEPVRKFVTWLRRCGKSSVLKLFQEHLLEGGESDSSNISINFESLDEEYPTEAKALYNYVVRLLKGRVNYVFLDEVQHVKDFERAVDALALGADDDSLFQRYMSYGGMPFTVRLDDEESISDYLGGVFSTIIVKDVAQRHPRMNMRSFNRTAMFLADNIGNISSQTKISRGLTAADEKVSVNAVGEYVDALLENYLAFKVERYNIKGREYLETLEKYYLGDLGFRFWLLGKARQDIGRCLENVVYLELLRRFRRVSVGKVGDKEIDFVAVDSGGPHYYQVSQTVMDPATLDRELSPLRSVRDDYPKTLLTLDRIGAQDHDGIGQVNIIDWLLGAS